MRNKVNTSISQGLQSLSDPRNHSESHNPKMEKTWNSGEPSQDWPGNLNNSECIKTHPGGHKIIQFNKAAHEVQLVALSCQQKVLGSTPGRGSFCMEFACSPCACVCSLQVLWVPPTVQKHDC
ncbi:hypothetical protein CHARACLAT_026649 [Characodon lateralis]|uniref:Uncharacterized protein n=1 Tax=Characodon lateralis TaxID=208331 RepID=A0ABU7D1N4_9TELE|nr:hypothetical protein [Characodon lateralis]